MTYAIAKFEAAIFRTDAKVIAVLCKLLCHLQIIRNYCESKVSVNYALNLSYSSLLHFFSCADPESFVRGGPTFLEGKEAIQTNTTVSGPSLTHQQNAV